MKVFIEHPSSEAILKEVKGTALFNVFRWGVVLQKWGWHHRQDFENNDCIMVYVVMWNPHLIECVPVLS